nr:MAG TPA: hypothetical protein [Caudoviricetes sp.]
MESLMSAGQSLRPLTVVNLIGGKVLLSLCLDLLILL